MSAQIDQVAELVEQGKRPREIAKELGLDLKNVYSLKAKVTGERDYVTYRRRFNNAIGDARAAIAEAIDIGSAAHVKAPARRALVAAAEALAAAQLWDDSFKQERIKKNGTA